MNTLERSRKVMIRSHSPVYKKTKSPVLSKQQATTRKQALREEHFPPPCSHSELYLPLINDELCPTAVLYISVSQGQEEGHGNPRALSMGTAGLRLDHGPCASCSSALGGHGNSLHMLPCG